ncbi:hypothetical protein BgiBS90_004855, partial [Biomphalaria glabrata]
GKYPLSNSSCYDPSEGRYENVPALSFSMLLKFRTEEESNEESDKSLITKTTCLDKEWLAPN